MAEEAERRKGALYLVRLAPVFRKKGIQGCGALAKGIRGHEDAVPDVREAGREFRCPPCTAPADEDSRTTFALRAWQQSGFSQCIELPLKGDGFIAPEQA